MSFSYDPDPDARVRASAAAALRDAQSALGDLTEGWQWDLAYRERAAQIESVLASAEIALTALRFPRAVIGSCAIDGSALRYVGRQDGLFVCCTNAEQHCWRVGQP